MQGEEEAAFQCPYCFQNVSVLVDLSCESQTYIEDCEVCCRPMKITYQSDGERVIRLEVGRAS